MRHSNWRRWTVTFVYLLGLLILVGKAEAASWADGLFREMNHDFGSVPRGSKVRHEFLIINRFQEPITVLDVRASCGCTTGRSSASLVPPGTSATINAEMDTRNFVGRKATVLYVNLVSASGKQAEIRLGVASTILSDIVFNPGTIDFGTISRGNPALQTMTIDRIGQPAWRVEKMISACQAIDASLVETVRDGEHVSYTLKVAIKPDAPAGFLRDEIRLVTNDPESATFPIQVDGLIRGDLTASPAVLSMGKVDSSESIQGKFIIRSAKPFRIVNIQGAGDGFQALLDDATSKPVHFVTINYISNQSLVQGDLRRVFRLQTDLANEPSLDLTATLHVGP